jgi:hypothetical protein
MSETIRTLRPGLLVSLKTGINGNIQYRKEDLERAHLTATGEERARWETERIISDPAEYEDAVKVRNKVSNLIRGVCAKSDHGLLCPEDKADVLMATVAEARKLADEFNAGSEITRVQVSVICGRVAQDDVEAVRAISEEVRNLMSTMQTGLAKLDVKAVRDACNQAKSLGEMLSDDAKERLTEAISVARAAATKIKAAGEDVALEIDKVTIEKIDNARTSFLDLDTEGEHPDDIQVVVDVRSIDLDDDA